ncbi:MAG TPA: twin-arginine translocation signal domain-containing protein, partial [Chryseolinea sp.]|nr:twin-arginine translocation signal domain-containing protein [Chryseolinea sp.]
MKNKRRDFLKMSGLAGLSIAGSNVAAFSAAITSREPKAAISTRETNSHTATDMNDQQELSIIGGYGAWAASLTENKIPSLSYRNNKYTTLAPWRDEARKKLIERMGIPD